MKSPLVTWKPWYWIALLFAFSIITKLVHPIVGKTLFVLLFAVVGWSFWELGSELHKRLPAKQGLNLRRFKVGVLYILGYFAAIIWFPSDEFLLNNYTPADYGWRWAVWPIGIAFMYFLFYNMFFISKAMCLLRKRMGMDEPIVLYLFLLWFFPIGIFMLQPRFVSVLQQKQGA